MGYPPTVSPLTDYLTRTGVDAYVIHESGDDADQRYLSGFDATDPFVTLVLPEEVLMLVGDTDAERAEQASRADTVIALSSYANDAVMHTLDPTVVADLLVDQGVSSVEVPPRFPVATADAIRSAGIDVTVDDDHAVEHARAVKTPEERAHIEHAAAAAVAAHERVQSILADAAVGDGQLHLDDELLTGTDLLEAIENELQVHSCTCRDAMVACGVDAAHPHGATTGPLSAGEPIIVDIFPMHVPSGYHADVTRTYVVGEASDEVVRLVEDVATAMERSLEQLGPGMSPDELNEPVLGYLEQRGHATQLTHDAVDAGAKHYIAHGVGLDVHERPVCLPGEGPLVSGNVLAVEPALYYPDIGGVRIEETVAITDDGAAVLSDSGAPIQP